MWPLAPRKEWIPDKAPYRLHREVRSDDSGIETTGLSRLPISLLDLKTGTLFSGTSTLTPLCGFRPMRPALSFTENAPKPRSCSRSCPSEWCNNGEAVVISGRAGSIKLPLRLDDWIITQRRNRFQAHVATALNGPFVVLFEQQRADEPRDRIFVGGRCRRHRCGA